MTTIAYRDGVLAADSQVTNGASTRQPYAAAKVWKLRDGRLAAACGAAGEIPAFLEWLRADDPEEDRPPLQQADVLVISADGLSASLFDEHGRTEIQPTPFLAYGSGIQAALGALHAGATAAEAVAIAAKVDVFTGGPIRTATLDHVDVREPSRH